MTTAGSQDPMVQGRRLRSELRRARQAASLTQRDVANALDWSASKLIRIERGGVGISITDLRALLNHYKITDEQRVAELVEMARVSKRPAWWTKYKHVLDPQFVALLGYEASAAVIRQYHGSAVPGLLQTEDYARAVINAYATDRSQVEDQVFARIERQQLLERDDPPEACFVLDEAVIWRVVGGPSVMRDQLKSLKELATRPNINIQVIRFGEGAHPGMPGPFVIYEFSPEEDEDYIVLLENLGGHVLVRNENGEASAYLERFQVLEKLATPSHQLGSIIDEVITELNPHGGTDRRGTNPPWSGPAGARGIAK